MPKYGSMATDVGEKKMIEALVHGKKLGITYFAVGDGGGSFYTPTTDMTKLKNEVWRNEVSKCYISEESENVIVAETVIPSDVGGFTIREMGIFDVDGTLIAIGNTPDTQKVKVMDGVVHELELVMNIAISNAENIELTVNPNVVTATKEDVEKLKTELLEEINEAKAETEGTYKSKGSVVFGDLDLASAAEGYVYNITDAFVTTDNFVDGTGVSYPAGTNVVAVMVGDTLKWDVLAGKNESSGTTGDITIFDPSLVTEAFSKVFSFLDVETEEQDPTSMSSADVQTALATEWDGSSSSDPTALNSEDVQTALETKWDGSSSTDPTALSREEIAEAIK